MIVGERIRERIEALGSSQAALARAIGVSPQAVSKMVSGETRETPKLHLLARELKTTPEYLTAESDDPEFASPAANPMIAPADKTETESDDAEVDSIDLAYGMGASFIEDTAVEVEKLSFSRSWLRNFTHSTPNHLFVAKGAGDSMNPTIHDSDIVLVDRSQTRPEMRDQIWAMTMAGMGMIKRLRPMTDGTMLIMSDNPSVSDDRATDGELFIVGRVVAIVRKV